MCLVTGTHSIFHVTMTTGLKSASILPKFPFPLKFCSTFFCFGIIHESRNWIAHPNNAFWAKPKFKEKHVAVTGLIYNMHIKVSISILKHACEGCEGVKSVKGYTLQAKSSRISSRHGEARETLQNLCIFFVEPTIQKLG